MAQGMPWEEYQSTAPATGQGVVIPAAPEKAPAPPSGYERTDGGLSYIPGGPDDPAVIARNAAARKGGEGGDTPEQPYSQSALDAFDRAISTADRLLTAPGLPAAVGSGFDPAAIGSFNPLTGKAFGGTQAADFAADLEAMKAQVFLPMVQSMKGLGQLSNAEGQKLTDAIGALDPNMSEAGFKASLERIKSDLIGYRNRSAPAGQEYVPPAAEEKRIIGAGERFMTDQDKSLQAELQGAFDRGAGVEELNAIGARYGRPPLQGIEQAIQARDSGTKGIKATVDPTGTGQEDAGAATAYFTGAANALTAGMLDELGGVIGLDPAQIEAGKRYLAEKQGLAYGLGEVSGGAMAMLPVTRGAQIAGLGARAPLAADIAMGAAYGAGEQNDSRLGGALMGGALGGVVGAGTRKIAGALTGRATPEDLTRITQSEQAGIPVMTSDIAPPETFMARATQQIGERVPFVGTGPVRAAQQGARQSAVQELLGNYGVGAEGVLDKVTKSLGKARGDELTKFTDMKKEVVSSLAGAGEVPVTNSTKAIDDAIAKLRGIDEASYKPVIERLQSQRDNLASGKTIDQIEGVRKLLGEMFDDPSLASIRGDGQKAVNSIYGPLAEDIKTFIRERAGQAAANKWGVANKRLSDMAGELKSTSLKSVLRQADVTPETVERMLFSTKPSDVRALYRNLPEEGRASARAAIMDRVFRDMKVDLEDVSPDQFANRVRERAKSIGVFFSGEEADRINGLVRALKLTQRASRAGVMTETGQQMLPISMASGLTGIVSGMAGGAATGGTVAAGTALSGIGLGALARIFESAPVRNAVMRMRNSKVGTPDEAKAAQAVRAAIATAANRTYQTSAKPEEPAPTASFEVPSQ
jgi:hypothetical protein